MRLLLRLATALRGWFRPGSLDADLSEELGFHLERQTQANIDAGMTPPDARRAAQVLLGNVAALRDESRAARHGALVHQLVRDLAFGVRLLRRTPGFAITASAIVALGIGATTAIVSVVYGVMLRPLPFAEPDRLVALWTRLPRAAQRSLINPADQRELRGSGAAVVEDIALVWRVQNYNLIEAGEPERVFAARVSSNLFDVLRVTPAIGRTFTEAEDEIGNDRVVLLSDGLWRRRFGADPGIVGRTINLTGRPFQVVGVMRPDFQYPGREHQLWVPLTINPAQLTRAAGGFDHLAVARLKPGVTHAQAQAAFDTIASRLEADHPSTHRGVRVELSPLLDEALRPVRPTFYVLLSAVGCLLLIACLNLANLLGTRAASRDREFAVRLAIGASRGRLVLQALAEVAPVLCLGGVVGILGARAAVAAFVQIAPPALPRVESIAVNGYVLVFAVALLAVTGLAASLIPAIHSWRASPPASRERASTGGRDRARTRHALVVAQLALALPLLVGAAVLIRSFSALSQIDPGFQPDKVLSLHLAVSRTKYTNDDRVAAHLGALVERMRLVPGVASAAMVNRLPLSGNDQTQTFEFDGVTDRPLVLQSRTVTPGYFETMGIPLVAGRDFTDADRAGATPVGVVDEKLARALWPGRSALGQRYRVTLPGQQPSWFEIVGVVGHVRHQGLDRDDDRQVYFSHQQFADGRAVLVVRAQADPTGILPAVRQAIYEIDAEQPVYDVKTAGDVMQHWAAQRWLNMTIVTVFGASALLLAGVGLYGVIAYGVAQRTREFGVRLALGAQRADITRLVVGKGAMLAACGLPLGLIAALALTRTMQTLLFEVGPLDPPAFLASALLVLAAALLASYIPARRAARADPATTLRLE